MLDSNAQLAYNDTLIFDISGACLDATGVISYTEPVLPAYIQKLSGPYSFSYEILID